MTQIDRSKTREIIDDFSSAINERKTRGKKPLKTVINFRKEQENGIEREIFEVPIELLRYRKDNGRIRADVISYEKDFGSLDEKSKEAQEKIRNMLRENDQEKNDELEKSISHDGQRDPAIITCDGFLINGNRRKMILETINEKFPGKYPMMRVVILPGKNEEGGPPTILEIEEIENRYQHQSEGKAEYSKFNTALSIKRKIEVGMTLDEQLRDNPIFADLSQKDFQKALKKYEDEYLGPLSCIDRYLEHLGREGLYTSIASGVGDREGKWQAFLDYYNHMYKKLKDDKELLKIGISKKDTGKVENIAFKLIRKREFPPSLGKVHAIMRNLPKYLSNPIARRELFEITSVPDDEDIEKANPNASPDSYGTQDKKWISKYQTKIVGHMMRAKDAYDDQKGQETPIELLEAALHKLEHDRLNIIAIPISDIPRVKNLIKRIKLAIDKIEATLYSHEKFN